MSGMGHDAARSLENVNFKLKTGAALHI